ncbi:MAG: hypothetical protein IIU65_06300 [Clostridia bacterium]|nr:hypothetical protein [Clostridia bacterium]
MAKSNYQESVKALKVYLKEKEEKRRDWAKEGWTHSDGKLFKIGRGLIPLLSVIGAFLMVLVCLIRFVNIPEIGKMLVSTSYGLNNTAKDDPLIYPFFALVFIALCVLIYCAIRFLMAKYKNSPLILFITSLFLSLCSLLRYFADQGTFPDNSDFDGAPTFTYFEYCLFTLTVFAVLAIYGLILLGINIKDNREFNRNFEHTLLKISSKSKNSDLLTEDEYAKLIDEFLENEKSKETTKNSKKRGKK